jgi:rubredoxin
MELQYICTVCGHVHDDEKEGKFVELSDLFTCPECGCFKDEYYSIVKEK